MVSETDTDKIEPNEPESTSLAIAFIPLVLAVVAAKNKRSP